MENGKKCYCRKADEFNFDEFLNRVKATGMSGSDSLTKLLSIVEEEGVPKFLYDIRASCYDYRLLDPIAYWVHSRKLEKDFVTTMINLLDEMEFIRTDWRIDSRIDALLSHISGYNSANYFEEVYKRGEYETICVSDDETRVQQVIELAKDYLPPLQYETFKFHYSFLDYDVDNYHIFNKPNNKAIGYTKLEQELLEMACKNLRFRCKKRITEILLS